MVDFEAKLKALRERHERLKAQITATRPAAAPAAAKPAPALQPAAQPPKTSPAGAIDGFGIQCKCGHHAPLDEFMRSPAGIDLPPRHYHCHACGQAWTIKAVAPAQVLASGFVVPPELACVPVTQLTL